MTRATKTAPKKTTKRQAAPPVADKCASCPKLKRLTTEKKRLTRMKARLEGQDTTPPALADVLGIVGKLQGMTDRANAKASWRQLAFWSAYQGKDTDTMTVFRAAQAALKSGDDVNFSAFFNVANLIILAADDRAKESGDLDETRKDGIRADAMREIGEHDMADLYLNDRAEFDRRFSLGERDTFDRPAVNRRGIKS